MLNVCRGFVPRDTPRSCSLVQFTIEVVLCFYAIVCLSNVNG